jgi:predicted HAD superfamily Cof-like phosphohydrolase
MSDFDVIGAVREFMRIPGQAVDRFDPAQATLYVGLQCEELAEKLAAISAGEVSSELRFDLNQAVMALKLLSSNFKKGKHRGAIMRADAAELLDGDIDLAWVSIGAAFSVSNNTSAAFAEVARANLAKYPNGAVTRDPESGKILKPKGWTGPDLSPYLSPRAD